MTIDLHGGRLGILAGGGDLPHELIRHCELHDIDYHVVFFKGQYADDIPADINHNVLKLGQTQKTINLLKDQNCTHIIFAGHIRRPSVFDLKPDLRTAKFFTKMGMGAAGDDRLLRAIRAELESEGFLVLGAHDILPDILTPEGLLTQISPDIKDWEDIKTAYNVLEQTGALDIGQGCVVQHGIVLGVEAVEGTDALIDRSGMHKRGGGGGVLVKRSKPGQDLSLDLPTAGEVTIENLKNAGLKGLALEAGKSQILHLTETVSAADAAGIFIIGFTADEF